MYKLACEHNKGSAAVAATTIETLRQQIPDADFASFVQFSDDFAKTHNIRVVRNRLFSFKYLSSSTIVKSSFNVIRCGLWALLHKRLPRLAKTLVNSRDLKEYANADVIVDISMDVYSDDFGLVADAEHSKDILIGVLLKKPVVIWAQSLGPFRSKSTSWLARYTLNKVALITVRDEISLSYLRELGVDVPPIHLTADPAFLLQPAPEERAKEILSVDHENTRNRPIIGLTMGWSSLISETNATWYLRFMKSVYWASRIMLPESIFEFAIKQASHFKRLDMANYLKIETMAQIVEHLVDSLEADVILIPHDISPMADDRFIAVELLQKTNHGNRIKLVGGDYSAAELKAVIGQCDLFLGGKMHANIAATSMYVPTVAIQYGHKFYGIMRMLGQEKYVCDKFTSQEVISKIDEAWLNREKIREQLKMTISMAKRQALHNSELTKGLLDSQEISTVL